MAIAFVQSKTSGVLSPIGGTVDVTFDSNVGAGNLIVICVSWDSSGHAGDTLSSIADTQTDTITQIGSALRTANEQSTAFYYAKNTAGGACTITATFTADRAFRCISASEYSGADTTAPLDTSSTSQDVAVTTGTDALTTSSVTPTNNNSLIVGMIMTDGLSGVTPGTNFNERVDPAAGGGAEIEDLTQSTAASIAATWTAGSASGRFNACVAAFKAAAAAGPPAPQLRIVQSTQRW